MAIWGLGLAGAAGLLAALAWSLPWPLLVAAVLATASSFALLLATSYRAARRTLGRGAAAREAVKRAFSWLFLLTP